MDLSANSELNELAGLVRDIRTAAPSMDPLLVGAMARDVLLHHGHGVRLTRATRDVDLAFLVADWNEFNSLQESLLRSGLFSAGRLVHRVLYRERLPVDLIPFGGTERPDRTIVWPSDKTVMSVLGYREARAAAIDVRLPQNQRILVVSLPVQIVLKLLAWSDRGADRPRADAADLFLILRHYLNCDNTERLYADAPHLLDADDFDYECAGAWLAGHDALTILDIRSESQSSLALATLETILAPEVDAEGSLRLVGETGEDADRSLRLLKAFYQGIRWQAL